MITPEQMKQDAITLDYTQWSMQRREAGLSTDHAIWQTERDKVQERWKRENEAARQRHLNNLEEERRAKQAERDAEDQKRRQAEEEKLKDRLKMAYMANPAASAEDFESDYPQLKSEYLRSQALEADEAARQSMANTMRSQF